MSEFFPVFLDLAGKSCLVVGGGPVATAKVDALLNAGASIDLIAPRVRPELQRLAVEGLLTWHERGFEPGDLARRFLVVAATGDADLHRHIHRLADAQGTLFNAVDEPAWCNFIFAATAASGPVQVAVSTSGASPTLAGRLRDAIRDRFLGPETGRLAAFLGAWRARVKAMPGDYAAKKRFWRAVLDSPLPEWLAARETARAERFMEQRIRDVERSHAEPAGAPS